MGVIAFSDPIARERLAEAVTAAKAHTTWKGRCLAILASLGMDFGEAAPTREEILERQAKEMATIIKNLCERTAPEQERQDALEYLRREALWVNSVQELQLVAPSSAYNDYLTLRLLRALVPPGPVEVNGRAFDMTGDIKARFYDYIRTTLYRDPSVHAEGGTLQ